MNFFPSFTSSNKRELISVVGTCEHPNHRQLKRGVGPWRVGRSSIREKLEQQDATQIATQLVAEHNASGCTETPLVTLVVGRQHHDAIIRP